MHHEVSALCDVHLTAISPTEWRVTDQRTPEGDPYGVIGFIQMLDGRYEVTKLGAPGQRSYYPSLAAAKACFVRPAAFGPGIRRAQAGAEKPKAILL